MRSKNHKAKTQAEADHIVRVKEMDCAVCGVPGPCEAHHIDQWDQFSVIPLCLDCHRGPRNGFHGQKCMWKLTKKTELGCLTETFRRLLYGMA